MFYINIQLFIFNKITEPVATTTGRFKALICFVNKLIYKLMGVNDFGENGCAHEMCLTTYEQ